MLHFSTIDPQNGIGLFEQYDNKESTNAFASNGNLVSNFPNTLQQN